MAGVVHRDDLHDRGVPIAVPGLLEPSVGMVDPDVLDALLGVLGSATGSPDQVYVAIWDGFGHGEVAPFRGAARLPTAKRGHLLAEGSLDDLRSIEDGALPAAIWWPADRAWLVHTEVDYHWTFVAGATPLVAALLASPVLGVVADRFDGVATRVPE
ncbi:hypothetical protein [Euzebya sp.]|uniref:hypothetical protein n=1 Tax=Euzebya sp. TaxID=1971409 RepID=UPI0035134E2B